MSIEIDGVEVQESSHGHGASWHWSSSGPPAMQYEIEWVQGKDTFLYGTRVPPGGWNVSELDSSVWFGDGTLDGAREMIKRGLPALPH